MDWIIRQIDGADAACILPLLDQVQAIHVEAHPDHYRDDYDGEEVLAWLRDWLSSEGTTALVAFAPEGSALGYLIFEVEARALSPLKHAQRWGMLHQIAVDQAWRRAGVGSALIGEMKARLRDQGIDQVRTVYAAFNSASAALMHKAGLKPFHITAQGST
jgi:GNAT superfamily N-acetyltransferase